MTTITDTIYVVEIPHRYPARAWVAYGEDDFITRVQRANLSLDIETYEQAVDAVQSDMHSAYVYRGDADALAGMDQIGGHQAIRAISALRRELEREGAIAPADDSDDED